MKNRNTRLVAGHHGLTGSVVLREGPVFGREEHPGIRLRRVRWFAILALVRKALATPASNILSALLWLALLGASAPQTFAQGGIPLWTNRYDGPVNYGDIPYAMAVAPDTR